MKYNWSKRINKKRSKQLFPCCCCCWKSDLTNQHITWHIAWDNDSLFTQFLPLSLCHSFVHSVLTPSLLRTRFEMLNNQKLWWIHFRFVYTLKCFSPLSLHHQYHISLSIYLFLHLCMCLGNMQRTQRISTKFISRIQLWFQAIASPKTI